MTTKKLSGIDEFDYYFLTKVETDSKKKYENITLIFKRITKKWQKMAQNLVLTKTRKTF